MLRFMKLKLKIAVAGVILGVSLSAWCYDQSLTSITQPYNKIVSRYTKIGGAYSGTDLDTKFRWYATFHSPDFREAFFQRYHDFYPAGDNPYAKQYMEGSAGPDQTEFFVALYAKRRDLKRMTGPRNLWDISLLAGDKTLKPIRLEEVPVTSLQEGLYPYLEKWYRAYRVVFPISKENISHGELVLQLSGVGGDSKLTFER